MIAKRISLTILLIVIALQSLPATELSKQYSREEFKVLLNKVIDKLISPEYKLSDLVKYNLEVTQNSWEYRQYFYYEIFRAANSDIVTPKRRKELIEYFVVGVNDPLAKQNVIRNLSHYKREDFSLNAMKILSQYYKVSILYNYNILLYGILDIHIRDQEILKLSQEPLEEDGRWLFGHRWVARLVMARRGNKQAIEEVKQNALDILEFENLTTDKDGIPSVTRHKKCREKGIHGQAAVYLFKNIAYIKQPESVDLLWAVLNSDEKIDKHTLFANCALTGLTILIDDFPVKRFPALSYPDGEIAKARKWMAITGKEIRKSFETKSADKKD